MFTEAPPPYLTQKQTGATQHPIPEPRVDLGKEKDIVTPQLWGVQRLQRMNTGRSYQHITEGTRCWKASEIQCHKHTVDAFNEWQILFFQVLHSWLQRDAEVMTMRWAYAFEKELTSGNLVWSPNTTGLIMITIIKHISRMCSYTPERMVKFC